MIITRTPFRVTFFGGGTDYPEFYEKHGGATLSATINKYCYISVHALSELFKYRFRASYAKTELVKTIGEFQHPLIRECLMLLNVGAGLEITHIADLPGRTGIGSSSSFTVGLLHALHALRGEIVGSEQLASEAIVVERERVGDAGGHQDQYAAAYGGLIRVEYGKSRQAKVRRLDVTGARIREFEKRLMLFYTGTEDSAQCILEGQRTRLKDNADSLCRMREMVDEGEKIVAGSGSLSGFGELLHETWTLKKGLAGGISNSGVDDAYNAARKAGALGGKLMGAGGRGFLLVFADPPRHEAVRRGLAGLKEVSFSLSSQGSQIIFQGAE